MFNTKTQIIMEIGDLIQVKYPKVIKRTSLGSEIEYVPTQVTVDYVFESAGEIIYFTTKEYKRLSFDKSQIIH